MIVLDASVLIAHVATSDPHHERATAFLLSTERALAMSPLTLAEFLVEPARRDRLDDAQKIIDELSIEIVELPPDAPVRLATLRAGGGVRLPDCCVLLAAQQVSAPVASFDRGLARAAWRLKIDVVDL